MSNERQVHQNNATGNTGPVVQNRDVYGDVIVNIIDGLSAVTAWVRRKVPIVAVVVVALVVSADAAVTATRVSVDGPNPSCGEPRLARGPILDKFLQVRAEKKAVLGCPLGPVRATAAGDGQFAVFERLDARYPDSIYWNPATGAWRVYGEIALKWAADGAEAGPLGFPAGDEQSNHDPTGFHQRFQYGYLYWHPERSRGAHAVVREFHVIWESRRHELGPLGYPVGDVRPTSDGAARQQDFERGTIVSHPAHGVHAVMVKIHEKWQRSGAESGEYGYPVAAEVQQGRVYRQSFERGEIVWDEAVQAYR